MLLHRPRYVLSLFPLSACFWWFFEYLNRFVQNWHYVGGGELSAWEYLVRATLPFSTVLPAVLGTAEWLSSFPRLSAGLDRFVTFEFKNHTTWGWGLLIGSAVGLFGIGLWPDYLFSLVWVAPLLLITSLQLIRDEPTICSGTAQGDWRTLWAAALAALICGWFWEMWNFYSLARWEYAVPFVQRFKLFEMPLLGYAGYSDVDTGALTGVAVGGATGNGHAQYSTDGITWVDFGAVSACFPAYTGGYQGDFSRTRRAGFCTGRWSVRADCVPACRRNNRSRTSR